MWGELASRKRLFNPPSQFSRLGILVPLDYLACTYMYMYFCVLHVSFVCKVCYGGDIFCLFCVLCVFSSGLRGYMSGLPFFLPTSYAHVFPCI